MDDPIIVFDRAAVAHHRDRAAPSFAEHDFLFRAVGDRLVDRLLDTRRGFSLALDLGCHDGATGRRLQQVKPVDYLVSSDISAAMAKQAEPPAVVADDEFLPFAAGSFDLVISNLSLHWVNDLPGALIQIRRAMKPDGFFLATIFGGRTLNELRQCLMQAEMDVTGGVSPRVSPFADSRDAGSLMQRAGFALPVVDNDIITVTYPNAFKLMADLRGMGETNAVRERLGRPTSRAVIMAAADLYHHRHAESDGRIPATFEIIYLTGWSPDASQPKPLRPGSADARLADALGATEQDAGEAAAPAVPPSTIRDKGGRDR